MFNSKDSDLDKLKAIGDELVQKGHSSVVEPYEKQIYQRWDELEKKLQSTENMLNMKLKEFEDKEREEQQRQAEKQKQMVVNEEVRLCSYLTCWNASPLSLTLFTKINFHWLKISN